MDQYYREAWATNKAHYADAELAIIARSMIAARRALSGPLPSEILQDYCLDALTYLFVMHFEQTSINRCMLIDVMDVKADIALRWLKVLSSYDLIELADDAVLLTDNGLSRVRAMLLAVAESQQSINEI